MKYALWKYPTHYAEENVGLGSGIMLDDVIAGIYTLVILHFARYAIERFSA